jgi:hypothetical protein
MSIADDTSSDEKDDEMICALTADERSALLSGLAELPDTMPPRAVWHRIREQAEAEGLFRQPAVRRAPTWYAAAGIAASAVLVAVLLVNPGEQADQQFPTVPDNQVPTNDVPVNALDALMVESRQLESDLRALPSQPRVVRAGTQATILELEDRIAAIDYQLSDPSIRMSEEEKELFWRERVRLMKSLVRLRYAQTQRASF